jgi:4-amino-4-deoxy-L-arabinose transferase-like glycosyltransferase
MALNKIPAWCFIIGIPLLLYLPFIGAVHLFEWDEINFAECAREMIVSNNYTSVQINFKPFWEKPPLFFWLQASCMQVFGINEFAARLPNTLLAGIQLLWLYKIGRKLINAHFAKLWMLAYTCSLLPHFYSKSGIIDPWFNFLIVSSLYYIHQCLLIPKNTNALLAGLLMGLAIITKGPVAMLLLILTVIVVSIIYKKIQVPTFNNFICWLLGVLLILSFWLVPLYINNGLHVLQQFISYQIALLTTPDAGHGGSILYHVPVILFGCLPISIILWHKHTYKVQQLPWHTWMLSLFIVGFTVFSIVTTKIVHYSSICYLPLSFMAAYFAHQYINGKVVITSIQKYFLAISYSLIGLILLFAPWVLNHLYLFKNTTNDAFSKDTLAVQMNVPYGKLLFGCIPIISLLLLQKTKHTLQQVSILIISTTLLVQCCIYGYIGHIQYLAQDAEISFFKQYAAQNVYIESDYKNYGQYFYTNKLMTDTLPIGDIYNPNLKVNKPLYIISRSNAINKINGMQNPKYTMIANNKGYVWWQLQAQ